MFLFRGSQRTGDAWFPVGLTSSFPDLGSDDGTLSEPRLCGSNLTPGCKVFHVPKTDSSLAAELPTGAHGSDFSETGQDMTDQVLVFQYRGKFHAINHVS